MAETKTTTVCQGADASDYQEWAVLRAEALNIDPEAGREWRALRESLFTKAEAVWNRGGVQRHQDAMHAAFMASRGVS